MGLDLRISGAGMRIVKLLVGQPPRTITDLMASAGVTRTAVTEQLYELVAAGFVERDVERVSGRGRPRYRFKATEAAMLLLFVGNQSILVPALLNAVEEIGGSELREDVLQRVSLSVADHYNRRIRGKTPAERLYEMAHLLRVEEGNLIDIEESEGGKLTVYRRSCSFYSMFEKSRAVCLIDEKVLGLVVGAPVRRTACRHDGDPCCVFEIAGEK